MEVSNAKTLAENIKYRINDPREQAALADCSHLMELSKKRIMDSIVALDSQEPHSYDDAHTWLSTVLTNHVTCSDGLEGSGKSLMEPTLNQLVSRARIALATFVAISLNQNSNFPTQPLIDELPSWITSKDRRLLTAATKHIKANANVVVAQDGSGNYKTLKEAVAAAPSKSKTRYVIYIKRGSTKSMWRSTVARLT